MTLDELQTYHLAEADKQIKYMNELKNVLHEGEYLTNALREPEKLFSFHQDAYILLCNVSLNTDYYEFLIGKVK